MSIAEKCPGGHPLTLVAEGYGICQKIPGRHNAWRFTPPATGDWIPWKGWWVWLTWDRSYETAEEFIQRDIEAHRSLPFDEEAERARLMPV